MNKNEFIADYSEFLYKAVYKIFEKYLHPKPREDELDRIYDIAVETIEYFSTKIDEGTLSFRGDAAFETFLYSSLKHKIFESFFGSRYVPKAVENLGEDAVSIFRFRYFEGLPPREVVSMMHSISDQPRSYYDELLQQIDLLYRGSTVERNFLKRFKQVNYDDFEPYIQDLVLSHEQTPEKEVFAPIIAAETKATMARIKIKLLEVMDTLTTDYRKVLELFYIEELTGNEIKDIMKIKSRNEIYRIKYAAERDFKRKGTEQGLPELLKYLMKLEDEK